MEAAAGFTLAVVIFAHRDPDQLAMLVSALRHPSVRIYVHLDAKVDAAPFTAATIGPSGADVVWLRRRSIRWGGLELVDAELDALERTTDDGCDYFTLISGQDFPIRPIAEIVGFFSMNRERSFVDHTPLPSDSYPLGGRERTDFYTYSIFGRRETYFPRGALSSPLSVRGRLLNSALGLLTAPRPQRRFPSYLRPFGGEMWVNLSREASIFVLDFVARHPHYRRYHRHTLVADEIFLTSIVAGSQFASDHEVVNDDLRYIRWSEPRGHHPEVLSLSDAPALAASKDMFARKLAWHESHDLLMHLNARITDGR